MNNRHEFLQQLFESIEFRLEIFSPVDFKYPPIFRDIRQAASGPMYRSLRTLQIETPALIENFKTLKVSTHLPNNKIILELAFSQRANPDDFSSFHEQPIGTYLIGDGETVELPELAQFGLAPMVAKAVRVTAEDIPLNQIPQKNYTTGLQIVRIRKKANNHLITVKNISDKTICSYSIGFDYTHGLSTHTTYQPLPAGAEDFCWFSIQPHTILTPPSQHRQPLEQEILVIRFLKYEDGSGEGAMPLTNPPTPTI